MPRITSNVEVVPASVIVEDILEDSPSAGEEDNLKGSFDQEPYKKNRELGRDEDQGRRAVREVTFLGMGLGLDRRKPKNAQTNNKDGTLDLKNIRNGLDDIVLIIGQIRWSSVFNS